MLKPFETGKKGIEVFRGFLQKPQTLRPHSSVKFDPQPWKRCSQPHLECCFQNYRDTRTLSGVVQEQLTQTFTLIQKREPMKKLPRTLLCMCKRAHLCSILFTGCGEERSARFSVAALAAAPTSLWTAEGEGETPPPPINLLFLLVLLFFLTLLVELLFSPLPLQLFWWTRIRSGKNVRPAKDYRRWNFNWMSIFKEGLLA